MSQNEPVYTCERAGFRFAVYQNRIDVTERKLLTNKNETLLLRNVSSVEAKAIGGKLVISLNDNTKREYVIGRDVEQARAAIVALL